ncbi:hypothetical protein MP228_002376 [Amoeboaphelidium protococcarum]|nr:hypothetical protein MP228_002376 [Amoeboaphelidium protococcarum]
MKLLILSILSVALFGYARSLNINSRQDIDLEFDKVSLEPIKNILAEPEVSAQTEVIKARETQLQGGPLNNDGPVKEINKYKSFTAAFMVITMSEIGDKTFIIAAILAMRNPRMIVFLGASSALVLMTVLSAALGYAVPNLIPRSVTQWLAGILFLVFGLKMLKEGYEMTGDETSKEMSEVEEELQEMQRAGKKIDDQTVEEGNVYDDDDGVLDHSMKSKDVSMLISLQNLASLLLTPVFVQTFVMTFLAEWGDRSQIATIALAASEDFVFVSLGASIAHCLCTGAAVLGGRLLASKISIRTVTIVGALGFIAFAFITFYYAREDQALKS